MRAASRATSAPSGSSSAVRGSSRKLIGGGRSVGDPRRSCAPVVPSSGRDSSTVRVPLGPSTILPRIDMRRVIGKVLRRLGYRRPQQPAASRARLSLTRIHLDEARQGEMLARATNPMEAAYYRHGGHLVHKWHHYLEVYDRHLGRFRGEAVHVLEIGIHRGGSLQVWKSYLGERAIIHGIDIDPDCAQFAEERIVPHIGDQGDVEFLKRVVHEMGRVDVVIDDGVHHSALQIATFEALYPLVDPNGVYVCEDTRASYWAEFGGGYRRPGTFVEYAKSF